MNMKYGRLKGGSIEYAPDNIVKADGSVVSNPSEETYLAAGWKRIAGETPAAEEGKKVEESGWRETETTLERVYKLVEDEAEKPAPRVFSKLKLVAALKAADRWVLVKTWIEEKGYWDYYLAAQNFREDNAMFTDALEALKSYTGMADAAVEAILSKCIWEED
ncbi:MAG: hypothetical protein K6F50_07470 [Kiritimatiellae bacterium]|nr:hypothetical protein [Kiritimatiellia bacterium]